MNDKKNPGVDFLNQIIDAFPQVNPEWLLSEKGPKFRTSLDSLQEPGVTYMNGTTLKLQDDIIKGLETNIFYLRSKVNLLEEEKKQLQIELERYKKLLGK